jgi:small subunit ribosomal protein S16
MIRLQRVGRKNDPSFRVIVTDSKNAAKRGRPTEIVGSYDARKGSPVLDAERIKYWTSQGAQVSGTVNNLLVDAKIVIGKKVNVLPKKTPIVKPAPAPEVKAPVAAKAEPASAEATDETEAEVAASEATPEATSETAV